MFPIQINQANYTQRLKVFLQSEEIKAYTMAILSFFAISFFAVFAIKPTLTTFFSLRRQIQDYEEFDKQLEDKINMLLKAQEQYQLYKNNTFLLSQALPTDPQFTYLIKKIEKISEETKTELSRLEINEVDFINSPDKTKSTEDLSNTKLQSENRDYQSFGFQTEINGSYQDSETFLKRLMNTRRIISLLSLKMGKGDLETGGEKIIIEVEGETYFLKK